MEGTEDQVIKPALEGTHAVLKACRDFKLKKCIFTSSIAAIGSADNIKDVYDENDWGNENYKYVDTYTKSKIMSEKLVWEFKKTLPKDSTLELVSLNPGFIVGKILLYLFNS